MEEWGGDSESLGLRENTWRGTEEDQLEQRHGEVARGGSRFKRDAFVFQLGEITYLYAKGTGEKVADHSVDVVSGEAERWWALGARGSEPG